MGNIEMPNRFWQQVFKISLLKSAKSGEIDLYTTFSLFP